MGVSENRGTPKWMVYNGKPENPIKMDELGRKPTILGNIHIGNCNVFTLPCHILDHREFSFQKRAAYRGQRSGRPCWSNHRNPSSGLSRRTLKKSRKAKSLVPLHMINTIDLYSYTYVKYVKYVNVRPYDFVLFVGATIRSLDFLITGHASISMKQKNSNNRPKSTNPRFCKKNKENLYHAGGHARQTHTSTHLHIWVTCALTHYFNIRVLGRWSMPFCQGGMFIHWQAEVVDKGCQHMAKASFGIGTLWWMKLLLKMCHSKINKRLTGQRWMVLYSTNPWWTHTSWNFTHFGWYLKTGLITSSNMLQKGNNWHKIWKSYWYHSTENMLAAQTCFAQNDGILLPARVKVLFLKMTWKKVPWWCPTSHWLQVHWNAGIHPTGPTGYQESCSVFGFF